MLFCFVSKADKDNLSVYDANNKFIKKFNLKPDLKIYIYI